MLPGLRSFHTFDWTSDHHSEEGDHVNVIRAGRWAIVFLVGTADRQILRASMLFNCQYASEHFEELQEKTSNASVCVCRCGLQQTPSFGIPLERES